MKPSDFYWLVGLLEGEGSFLAPSPSAPNQPRIAIHMTDLDVIERVAALFGISYIAKSNRTKPGKEWKPSFKVILRGRRAADLMQRLRPYLGIRRQQQIDRALANFNPMAPGDNTRKLTAESVLQVRKRLTSGESVRAVAGEFGVSRDVIRKVRDRRIWRAL